MPNPNGCQFIVDCGGQLNGGMLFRHVPQAVQSNAFYDEPNPPNNYAVTRFEGTQRYGFGWFAEDSSSARTTPWATNSAGDIVYTPTPAHKAFFDTTLRWGLTPLLVMGTPSMPAPLMEGGHVTAEYGYPVRQPNSYPKWHTYLKSMFQWLADTYSRDAVRNWTFLFGIEMDWQIKCVIPGTQTLMNESDNRRECIKMMDYWIDAAEQVLGSQLYMGCYYAFPGQAEDYVKHWAEGTNYATGKKGTNIGWFGFSDWTVLSEDWINPFSPIKRKNPKASIGMTFAAGMKWKSDYLNALTAKYPQLSALEIHMPEYGYFDSYGGTDKNGQVCAAETDFAEQRGAALYNMKNICAGQQPNVVLAWNRYALTTGDLGLLYYHAVHPPVFHAIRISKMLEGSRVLPVSQAGQELNPEADVRLGAYVQHDKSTVLRCLMVHLREGISATGDEPVSLKLDHLPIANGPLQAELYLIDEKHNNWWTEWLQDRQRYNIPYELGPNGGHLGRDIKLAPKYMPLAIDIRATVDNAGWAQWARLSPKYKLKSAFKPSQRITLTVKNGQAEWEGVLPAFGSALLQVVLPIKPLKQPELALTASGWRQAGAQISGQQIVLHPSKSGGMQCMLSGLQPGKRYSVYADVKMAHRFTRLELKAGTGSGVAKCTAIKHPRQQQLIVTARADSQGRLPISLSCPLQKLRPQDTVTVYGLKLYPQMG